MPSVLFGREEETEDYIECEKLKQCSRGANRHPASGAKGLFCFLKLVESSKVRKMHFFSLQLLEEMWGKEVVFSFCTILH